jgi:hypothetical protein
LQLTLKQGYKMAIVQSVDHGGQGHIAGRYARLTWYASAEIKLRAPDHYAGKGEAKTFISDLYIDIRKVEGGLGFGSLSELAAELVEIESERSKKMSEYLMGGAV